MSHEDQEEITWVPFREPVRNTLARTVGLALIIGSIIAWTSHGRLSWPVAVLVALWPALGGHFVELWFLNLLRPRLSASRGVQVGARVITWAVAGVVMLVAMRATARVFSQAQSIRAPLLIGAFAFVIIELIAHLGLQLGGRPSFYNARG